MQAGENAIGDAEARGVPTVTASAGSSSRNRGWTHVLKEGDSFLVTDGQGDVHANTPGAQGLFHEGTRHLVRCAVTLGGKPALPLVAGVDATGLLLATQGTNQCVTLSDGRILVERSVLLSRQLFLWQGVCYLSLVCQNLTAQALAFPLAIALSADFADLFAVRGFESRGRGTLLPVDVEPAGLTYTYQGRDGVLRRTRVTATPFPHASAPTGLEFSPATGAFHLLPRHCL